MGLVVLLVIVGYLAALFGGPLLAYKWAAKRGWVERKRSLAAAIAFLIIFLPMFWDWLPTIWLHSYYCEKYSGVTVTKTPEQWKQANPGVAETLVAPKNPTQVGAWPKFSRQLNQRFRLEVESKDKALWLKQYEERVVDEKSGETLVRFIDFSTGQSGSRIDHLRDIKIWMRRESCDDQALRKKFGGLRQEFENVGSQK